jgi:hypothetical protein
MSHVICHGVNFDCSLRYDTYDLLPWSLAEGTLVFFLQLRIRGIDFSGHNYRSPEPSAILTMAMDAH